MKKAIMHGIINPVNCIDFVEYRFMRRRLASSILSTPSYYNFTLTSITIFQYMNNWGNGFKENGILSYCM